MRATSLLPPPNVYVTVAARNARDVERVRSSSAAAMSELHAYASAHAGRYLVFGSVARGDLVPASDFDVLVDFSESSEHARVLSRGGGLPTTGPRARRAFAVGGIRSTDDARSTRCRRARMSSAQWIDVEDDVRDAEEAT